MATDKFKVWLAALGAFIALIVGLNWDSFFAGMAALPKLVQAWSTGMPLGFWSVVLGTTLGMGVWGMVIRHRPTSACGRRPHFCADTTAILIGLFVVIAQQWGGGAPQMVNAMFMGLLSGLAAPYLARAIWSVFASIKDGANKE